MKLKKNITLQSIGNEKVLVSEGTENVDFTNIISLNNSAARLWEALGDQEFSNDTIAQLLCEWYEVDEETALQDAKEVVEAWAKAGILE